VWGSDVKKLRKEVLAVLGPSVSEEDLNTILAPKAEVMLVKMSNKAVVFTVNGQPLFFDPHGRGGVADAHILPAATSNAL
jgi:predicted ribosome-associated RNA-binding protein Tma20